MKTAYPSICPEKLLNSIVDVVCAIGEDGIFQYVSPSCTQLFGYSPEEMTGASFLSFVHPNYLEKTVAGFQSRTHDCNTSNFENKYFRKDGSVIPVIWSARWDANDKVLYCVARNGLEKCEIEQRLFKAQELARVANYEYDVVNDFYTYTSKTLFEIFGLDKDKHSRFTTELFWTLVHPDDLNMVKQSILQPEYMYNSTLEYRIIRPDGRIVFINRIREVVRDVNGNPVKTIGTLQDITDRKIGELALKQSEDRLRSLLQNCNDMLGVIDTVGNYLFVGDNVSAHMGYTAKELMGTNAFDFIHPQDADRVAEMLQELKEKDRIDTGPFRFRNKEGAWRWVETTVSNHLDNPAIGGLVVNSRDITDKKLRDDALIRSQQKFKALVKNGSDLIVIIDEIGNFSYVSENVVSVLGYTPEEMVGRNAFDFIYPDDKEKIAAEIGHVLHNEEAASGVQHRFLHKNGSWIWLESKGSNHYDNQSINGILVNSRNISDRIKLQKELNRELINKQRDITAAVIRAQETERSQIGLELHDNVNQILTTVKLYNEMYLTGYMQHKDLLAKATQYTQECIDEIRSISKRLSAPTLGSISLHDSIEELVNSINLSRRLDVLFFATNLHSCVVSEDLHLAVYRIVQEGLNNIIKYSQAKAACIELKQEQKSLCLVITDDGIGFDTASKRPGIGIANMKTRAESLHAAFKIESAPGKGCVIRICFPLYEQQ